MPGDTFADDVIEELLKRTEEGEPLTKICSDSRMPGRRTVYEWIEADKDFAAQFHAARARGIHALAEECLDIADAEAKDPVEVANKRVRIDTRLRLAGKWLPSIYGDKTQLVGGDPSAGDKPIQTEGRTTLDVSALTEEQLRVIASVPVIRR